MTWSGWVANLMSNEPMPPTSATTKISTVAVRPARAKERATSTATVGEGGGGASAPATSIGSVTSTDVSLASELQAQDRYLEEQVLIFKTCASTNKDVPLSSSIKSNYPPRACTCQKAPQHGAHG